MLFAARPDPKKVVSGKLTKEAAAALFEKYYGPGAVMEQILGSKRQLESRRWVPSFLFGRFGGTCIDPG